MAGGAATGGLAALALHHWAQHSMPDPQQLCCHKLQHVLPCCPAQPACMSPC